MLDLIERHEWFMCYLDSALKFPEARGSVLRAVAWARSMSLIAEQFVDDGDRDLVDAE